MFQESTVDLSSLCGHLLRQLQAPKIHSVVPYQFELQIHPCRMIETEDMAMAMAGARRGNGSLFHHCSRVLRSVKLFPFGFISEEPGEAPAPESQVEGHQEEDQDELEELDEFLEEELEEEEEEELEDELAEDLSDGPEQHREERRLLQERLKQAQQELENFRQSSEQQMQAAGDVDDGEVEARPCSVCNVCSLMGQ